MKAMLLVGVLLMVPTKYERAADRLQFPSRAEFTRWARKSAEHKRVVDMIRDRGVWARAFRTIESKVGLFNADCRIQILLEATPDARAALGGGDGGRGVVRFNMPRLVELLNDSDRIARLKAAGRINKVIVPPMSFEGLVTHELTHVFCGVYEDKWVTEGVACYTGSDPMHLYAYNHRGARVESLDLVVPAKDCYGRGMLFFLWMESEYGRDKVHEFVRLMTKDEKSPEAAASQVTGQAWPHLALREKYWSISHLRKYEP